MNIQKIFSQINILNLSVKRRDIWKKKCFWKKKYLERCFD